MIPDDILDYLEKCKKLPLAKRVEIFNELSDMLKNMVGIDQPVLGVRLVKSDKVEGNDYNPNKVPPPEMALLELSMRKDGVTMPIVAGRNDKGRYVIVDGFHRTEIMKRAGEVNKKMQGYIPLVELNKDITDRITATVRHNMARGSHQTELAARLVTLLKKHNWSDEKIGKELGMEPDEVLRLKQMTGLAEAFADKEFSRAWE